MSLESFSGIFSASERKAIHVSIQIKSHHIYATSIVVSSSCWSDGGWLVGSVRRFGLGRLRHRDVGDLSEPGGVLELAGVGLLAGFLASAVAVAVGWALARYVFNFAWTASWLVLVLGSLAGAVLALAAGWWGLRSVLNTPVVQTLRQSQ